ncbi:MAG TPA: hypothetical protein PKK74_04820 [Candidatus Methanoculleus thermohydrogenotrophicum]|mgnify:CR=1 FL=1|jgi:hypothetical protein|nr:hypothetical protein [Candidatus Methanoculleus thermohydrogenotrophicum]NLM82255.1 hypothetical protein [Candidatus Methanoculleus thermohydrogenotrophicum]HOB18000.1 hypothetical protein [Candidatus Methanoculleus thermohydrogenotrophicum]HPZ38230.1 hypothetical protein [Candidatus Methanoculleus thermohydrogenotrophicum]HQC91357.1 hypothetical protein [Candidatus Methanoculleus thermohydrogenotrophicum]
MPGADYIYPNVTEVSRRGGLLERWRLAEPLGCTYVEIPGDFIKNKTEVERTGQDIGSMLTRLSIEQLYQQETDLPYSLRYVLHTEPALPRRDHHGRQVKAELRWRDPEWVIALGNMLLEIEDFLGIPPDVIEIHPGDWKNDHADIAAGMHTLITAHREAFGVEPLVLLENHKDQSISTGSQMQAFWETLTDLHPGIAGLTGIALDPGHLHAVAKEDFARSLRKIPPEALKAFHIHSNLRPPSITDEVPWSEVFSVIRGLPERPCIKPLVYQKSRVAEAIAFCEEMLAAPEVKHAGPPA